MKNRLLQICVVVLATSFAGVDVSNATDEDAFSSAQHEYYQQCKKRLGKRAIVYVDAELCMRADFLTFGYVGWDFAEKDLVFYGQRTTASSLFPFLFYGKQDVSDETDTLKGGLSAQANFTFVEPTLIRPAVGYISLEFSTEGDFDSLFDKQNVYNYGEVNLYPGIVKQAWVRKRGLSFGIQPSKFDFMRSGFSLFPGYAGKESLASIGYTHKVNKNFSVGVAFEDGRQREREDGVLAHYDDDEFRVDPVLLLRARQGLAVYHLSGALHTVDWDGTPFGIRDKSELGVAVRAGILLDLNRRRGKGADDISGRFLASVAYANGAMDYLGIPDFAVDYIARQDGTLDLSEGVSAVGSYEYPFSPTLRGIVSGSGFYVNMGSEGHLLPSGPGLPLTKLGYDMNVYGAKFQLSLEKVLSTTTFIGAEASYNWTKADGAYNELDTDGTTVQYPEIKAYFTKRF